VTLIIRYLNNYLQIEHVLPSNVPILSNDRPYTIEVYDCTSQQQIEVLRINLDSKRNTGIEMGSFVSLARNKVAPSTSEEMGILPAGKSVRYVSGDKSESDLNPIIEDDEEERQQWSNPVEFLLSCVAMSVGLGSKPTYTGFI